MRGKRYTQQEMYDAVTLARTLCSVTMASKEIGIPARTIYDWMKQEDETGVPLQPEDNRANSSQEKKVPSSRANRSHENAADDQPLTAATLLPRLRAVHASIMASIERLASGFDPDDPDINHRAIALTRLLDRVFVLNDHISKMDANFGARVYRIGYRYPDGSHHNYAPWVSEENRHTKPFMFETDPETGKSWAIPDPDYPPDPNDNRYKWKYGASVYDYPEMWDNEPD